MCKSLTENKNLLNICKMKVLYILWKVWEPEKQFSLEVTFEPNHSKAVIFFFPSDDFSGQTWSWVLTSNKEHLSCGIDLCSVWSGHILAQVLLRTDIRSRVAVLHLESQSAIFLRSLWKEKPHHLLWWFLNELWLLIASGISWKF